MFRVFGVVVLALTMSTCAEQEEESENLIFDDDDGKTDELADRPYGTWTRELADDEFGFYSLTLNEARRFHYLQRLVRCDNNDCTDELSGRYRYAYSHEKRYIVVYNGDDRWYSFEYILEDEGNTLRLRDTGGDRWFTLHRAAEAWCELPEDCAGQDLEVCAEATFSCSDNVCQDDCEEVEVDEETCQGYEGAIDDCIGLHGMRHNECIDELGGEPIRVLLRSCCEMDSLYYFCPVDRPMPTGFQVPLLDENDWSLLALRNDEIIAGGFDPLPETALITGDDIGVADFQNLQDLVEEIDAAVDLGTLLMGYADPGDYRAQRADGSWVELCYTGPVEGVPNAMMMLTDNVFSDQLSVFGWKYEGEIGTLEDLEDVESWFPPEWTSYQPSDGAILIVSDSTDSGSYPSATILNPCP